MRTLNWGEIENNPWFKKVLHQELVEQNVYLKFFRVEQNDIVLDVGASMGIFTNSILDSKPKMVFCLEPYKNLYDTLVENLGSYDNVCCINQGISNVSGSTMFQGLYNPNSNAMWSSAQLAEGITFQDLITKYDINLVNFLKSDCEGGEYDIFNTYNYDWILNKVKYVAGEWHLHNQELKNKFKEFRNTYLNKLANHQIFSMDGVDIKCYLWEDWFLEYYSTIMVYIDNSSTVPS